MIKNFSFLLFSSFFAAASFAQTSCDLLLDHGITNITRYLSSEHTIAYKWHSNCGVNYSLAGDSQVKSANANIFGYGSGGANLNVSQMREKWEQWCNQNEEFSEKNASLAEEAKVLSQPALKTFERCVEMTRKQISISVSPLEEHAKFLHATIDSTHDGDLVYLGLEKKNFECTELMVRKGTEEEIDIKMQPKIGNANIQISCERAAPKVTEKKGVGRIEYEAAYISINTSGPAMPISFPEVVSDYLVTPPGSVIAFNSSDKCPEGWKHYEPAYGRFVRGIDLGGNADPNGKRAAGTLQDDTFASHRHSRPKDVFNNERPYLDGGGGIGYGEDNGNPPSTGYTGDTETRPKNVALLYCIKK